MHAAGPDWTPDPFATRVERRADGSLRLTPEGALAAHPPRFTDWFEQWAHAAPARVLVARRGADGVWREVTYAQMFERVVRLAGGLATLGLSAERPLLILSGNGIEHLALALAALWAGIPYCPVSPAYSQVAGDLERLRHVLALLTPGAVAAFDTPRHARALALVPPGVPLIGDSASGAGAWLPLDSLERADAAGVAAAHEATGPDTILRFLLTSGSTGRPKAVITTHRMCCANAAMLAQALPFVTDEPPVLLDWLPWNHTFGGSHNLGLVLAYGGTLYIDDGRPTDGGFAQTARNLREIAPTVYFNVPKGFDMLARALQDDAALRANFYRRLRTCFFAGASLSQQTWDALDAASLRERGRRTPMLSGLGATETGPSVTFTTPRAGRAGIIGWPAAGAEVKLAPVEQKLELRVRGPAVTPGYWRQPQLSAQAFDAEGFYRLGDAVRLVDAADPARGLMFDGRIGEDFKLANGTWVSVGPLRAELIAALSPLAQDVVIAGLDAEYAAALVIPDVAACGRALGDARADRAALARDARLVAMVRERLTAHARANPASTRCVRRAALLTVAPSLDRGEITDKGSINQRAVLAGHAGAVAELYLAIAPEHVAVIDPAATR
jgi:feruloyl-CoA synthase